MSTNIAIKVENLSKAYQLGQIGTGTISRDLERWYARMRGKEDPFLRIGESNDQYTKSESDVVWSLKGLNFEIEQGDAVGIIGRNGAGKSTLLKILSKVTAPTTGKVSGKGRIASLLEVGTGFHPELTGRENIFLNGTILGMRKREIQRKLEEIVDFAGIERYLDTPVKRYSSGMYVRLAFAVAAHLESEILIVDEVLAVGDAEFQKKCLGKMGEVSKGEGRTVLFVSHNMDAITNLCKKAILLDKGRITCDSTAQIAISYYNQSIVKFKDFYFGNGLIRNARLLFTDYAILYDSNITLEVDFEHDEALRSITLGLIIKDVSQTILVGVNNKHYQSKSINKEPIERGTIIVNIKNQKLLPGKYTIDLFLGTAMTDLEIVENALSFEVGTSKITKTNITLDPRINKLFIKDIEWELNPRLSN